MALALALLFVALALAHGGGHNDQSPLARHLRSLLQPKLDGVSLLANTSFSIGVADAEGWFGLVGGIDDHATGKAMAVDTQIPLGSCTKFTTAALMLQLHEQGKMDLDAPVHKLVDPWLLRTNGTTLMGLWNDSRIEVVTARQLLSMRSGLADYDDAALQSYSLNPGIWPRDTTPYDYLHRWAPKSFLFDPGTGGAYSSIGFVLAGFAAAAATGAADWDALDQNALLAAAGADGAAINAGLNFVGRGACAAYANVSHQYFASASQRESPAYNTVDFVDIRGMSCLNGWTMGNLAAAPQSLAALLFEALSPNGHRVLSTASIEAMLTFQPLTTGWSSGLQYGVGAMELQFAVTTQSGKVLDVLELVGHAGQDWGSGAPWNFYNAKHDFSITLATSSATPMNCSLLSTEYGIGQGQALAGQVAACTVCEIVAFKQNGTALPAGDSCPCTPTPPGLALPLPLPLRETSLKRTAAKFAGAHGIGAAPLPYLCPTGECAGGLSASECSAWKSFYVGLGRSDSACVSDPCSATDCGVTCAGGHITEICLPGRGLSGDPFQEGGGLAAFTALTKLDLSNNTLFGDIAQSLAHIAVMPKLVHLNLHANVFSGKLPADFDYSRFGGYCDVGANDFDCPVPDAAAACAGSGAPPACSAPPVSSACMASIAKLYATPGVGAAVAQADQFMGAVGQAAGAQCSNQFQPGHMVCHANASAAWQGNADAWRAYTAARAAAQAAGAGNDLCFLTMDNHQYCGTSPCEIVFAGFELGLFGADCLAADRDAWAQWLSRPSQCLKDQGARSTCNTTITQPLQCGLGGR